MQPGNESLIERVTAIVADVTGVRTRDTNASLELSALGRAELSLALEDAFGVRIDDGSSLSTVNEAAAAVLRGRRRPAPSLHSDTGRFQSMARAIVAPPVRWYFRLTVRGEDRVPRSGPLVLAANHDSMWDVPLLVAAISRPIVFMAVAGVFGSGAASWVFTRLGGFPVRRGVGDLAGLRAALDVVRSNRMLGMFPEGTRRPGTLLRFRPGAAWIALATGAPLAPAGIAGTGEIIRRGWIPHRSHVQIMFGEPIDVVQEDEPQRRLDKAADLTQQLRSDVERLIQR